MLLPRGSESDEWGQRRTGRWLCEGGQRMGRGWSGTQSWEAAGKRCPLGLPETMSLLRAQFGL